MPPTKKNTIFQKTTWILWKILKQKCQAENWEIIWNDIRKKVKMKIKNKPELLPQEWGQQLEHLYLFLLLFFSEVIKDINKLLPQESQDENWEIISNDIRKKVKMKIEK